MTTILGSGFGSPGLSAFALDIYLGELVYNLTLAKDDKSNPLFSQRTAPTVPPVIQGGVQTLDSRSVPPEQGIDLTVGNVKGGAGSWLSQPGRYAFGSGIFTGDGIIEPGPLVEATLASMDGFNGNVRSYARFADRDWVGTDSGYVYYWDYKYGSGAHGTDTWNHVDQPDSGGVPITDLVPFTLPDGTAILIAFMDANAAGGHTYQFMDDFDPDTPTGSWSDPVFGGQEYGKHAVELQNTTLRPVLVMVNDPNEVWYTEDPTDSTLWVGPTYISQPGDIGADHFTGITVSPDGNTLFIGKKLGLWLFDKVTGVVQQLEHIPADKVGGGLENFAWFQRMGGALFVQAQDVDCIQVDRYGNVTWGFGPYRAGPGVPEMQKAIVAMAADNREWVYFGLDGSEGYVMMARYQEDGRWHFHGAYVATGVQIANRMWLSSNPLADPGTGGAGTAQYLWVTQKNTNEPPFRCRIPEGSSEADPDHTEAEAYSIRFGYEDAGQVNLPKVLLSSAPRTRNLSPEGATATIKYRTEYDGSFSTLNTFDTSPAPTDPTTEQYSDAWGYVFEIAVDVDNPDGDRPIIDAVTTRALRRFIDDSSSPRLDILTFTVEATTGVRTGSGAMSRISMQQLYATLRDARGALFLPRIVRPFDGAEWIVDILAVSARWASFGTNQPSMFLDVTAQQLPVSANAITPPFSPINVGRILYGSGAPADSLGANGDGYNDLSSPGSFYVKAGGTWTQVSGGGGGGTWGDITTGGTPETLGDDVLLALDDGSLGGIIYDTANSQGWALFTGALDYSDALNILAALPDHVSLYSQTADGNWYAQGLFSSATDSQASFDIIAQHGTDVAEIIGRATGEMSLTAKWPIVHPTDTPDNSLGNDGDITFYNGQVFKKDSGVWTAIVGSTGLTNPVGDDITLWMDTAATAAGWKFLSNFGAMFLDGTAAGIITPGQFGFNANVDADGNGPGYPSFNAYPDGQSTGWAFQGQYQPVLTTGPYRDMQLIGTDASATNDSSDVHSNLEVLAPTFTGDGMGPWTYSGNVQTLYVEGPPVIANDLTAPNAVGLYVGGGDDALRFGTAHAVAAETATDYLIVTLDDGSRFKLLGTPVP